MTDLEKMLAEATPGPWCVDPDPREGMEWNRHVIDYDFNRVCFMAHNGGQKPETDESNARLIALAPSLAAALLVAEEALRDIDDRIEKAASCHHNADEWDDRTLDGDLTIMDWVMSPVRAALSEIAKLTGGGE